MTCALFEAHVNNMQRIQAAKSLRLADIIMLPKLTKFARGEWFRTMTKNLRPSFSGKNAPITFDGKIVNFKQLKSRLKGVKGATIG